MIITINYLLRKRKEPGIESNYLCLVAMTFLFYQFEKFLTYTLILCSRRKSLSPAPWSVLAWPLDASTGCFFCSVLSIATSDVIIIEQTLLGGEWRVWPILC